MDLFKKAQHNKIGIGGIKCNCCNDVAKKGRDKVDRGLNRMARAKMKMETLREVNEFFQTRVDDEFYMLITN